MALLLYINGQLTDIDAGTVIAQTRQVNDLNSLDDRQASYTNKFSLPKTANNMRIMQFLTLPGNNSPVPYQKNECSLYSASGECFVYKGWAVITDGGDSYDAVIYDGIIDLYKAIENKTLTDLGLEELTHDKNIANIKNTWDNDMPYRYILTDYNGDTGSLLDEPAPSVNIDYLVPAVKVSWLWEKIFHTYNHNTQPRGSVFESFNFKQLWLTYPKGVPTVASLQEVYKSDDISVSGNAFDARHFIKFRTAETNELLNYGNGIHLTVPEEGNYTLRVSGNIHFLFGGSGNRRLFVGKNSAGMALGSVPVFRTLAENINGNFTFDVTINFHLYMWQSICLITEGGAVSDINLSVTLTKVNASSLDFSLALSDFSIRDFLTEVVHRFGLTMYTKRNSHEIEFLTLQEVLQTPRLENWSAKFSKKVSENYMYGNYAQLNWFRYQYNDKESNHNDGNIAVNNFNLPDTRDAIKSKIYSPEKKTVDYLGQQHHVYRLWDKELKEGSNGEPDTVTYKPLDKRYYFIRAVQNPLFSSVRLFSTEFPESERVPNFYTESFYKLSFGEIIHEYYTPLQNLLNNNTCITTAQLWLTDTDIVNFDFKKLYYIEQLSSYFIMNKINNYIPGKATSCELIRVPLNGQLLPAKELYLEFTVRTTSSIGGIYTVNYTPGNLRLQWSLDFITWNNAGVVENNGLFFFLPAVSNTYHYRVYDTVNQVSSNIIDLIIP